MPRALRSAPRYRDNVAVDTGILSDGAYITYFVVFIFLFRKNTTVDSFPGRGSPHDKYFST